MPTDAIQRELTLAPETSANIGRIAAAAGTIFSAAITRGGNFRHTLFLVGFLFAVAGLVALFMPARREIAEAG